MVNPYLPDGEFEPVPSAPPEQAKSERGVLGGLKLPGLDGILKSLHLDRFDKGDILLALVLIYLFWESEDEDWLIVLALVLLML